MKLSETVCKYVRDNEDKLLLLVLFVGILIRVYSFGSIPPGLNQDEASTGYDAYSILHYGIDRNGFHNPVYMVSWGSGQNALSVYLSMPFIYLFGLNVFSVRIVNLVFGLLTLPAFYLLVREISDKRTALLSTFLLTICPWHIMCSRWGLDVNILPAIFLIGTLFFVSSYKKTIYLPVAFLFFALSLYAYATAYFMVPTFLLISLAYLVFHKKVTARVLILSTVVFLILASPILLFIMVNKCGLDTINLSFLSIPKLKDKPVFEYKSIIFNPNFTENALGNLKVFVNLILRQNDGLIWNVLPPYGFAYPFSVIFLFIGLLVALKNQRPKKFHKSFFLLTWFLLSVILAVLMRVNVNRINIIFLPIIFFTAVGILHLKSKLGDFIFYSIILAYLISFSLFTHAYLHSYPQRIGPAFFESLGDAIDYASDNTDGLICVTNKVNMPYIFVLFYRQIDPNIFISTVEYSNPESQFGWVSSFDRYHFGFHTCGYKNETYVFHRSESKLFSDKKFSITDFKYYSVAIPRHQSET